MKTRIPFIIALAATFGLFAASLTIAADDAVAAKEIGTISGRVVNKDGPVAGAKVIAVIPKRPLEKPNPKKTAAGNDALAVQAKREIVATATTDADGKYTLTNVPAGRVRVAANLKGTGFGFVKKPVQVLAGQNTKVEDITLEPRQPNQRPGGKGEGKNGKLP